MTTTLYCKTLNVRGPFNVRGSWLLGYDHEFERV